MLDCQDAAKLPCLTPPEPKPIIQQLPNAQSAARIAPQQNAITECRIGDDGSIKQTKKYQDTQIPVIMSINTANDKPQPPHFAILTV
mmetsp:Transcript_75550/g.120160  ORF Transcript_75550/g.120160 Transcript_75550/m.120160 type:complete len:87 (+) Transcript_75550:166-426(+)